MSHDVFISHSSADKRAADAACGLLEARGIKCWIAPRDIRPGSDWGESIITAIEQTRIVLLTIGFLSAQGNYRLEDSNQFVDMQGKTTSIWKRQ